MAFRAQGQSKVHMGLFIRACLRTHSTQRLSRMGWFWGTSYQRCLVRPAHHSLDQAGAAHYEICGRGQLQPGWSAKPSPVCWRYRALSSEEWHLRAGRYRLLYI